MLLVYLFTLLCFSVRAVRTLEFAENLVSDPVVARKWVQAAKEFDSIIFPHKSAIVDFLSKNLVDLPVSPHCSSSLSSLANGLRDKKLWAYHFLDASARGRSGLAAGYISDLGDITQCLSIRKGERQFSGSYCLLDFKFPLTQKPERNFLRVRLCTRLNLPLTPC